MALWVPVTAKPGEPYAFPYVPGAFVGMIAGNLAGALVEFVLKMLPASAYGRLLADRPLTVFTVFHDSEDVISLCLRFGRNRKTLKMTFENDELAREFIALTSKSGPFYGEAWRTLTYRRTDEIRS